MTRWTFVRHGESLANAEGWFAGHTDAPLTARGRAQAEQLREQLATYRFDRVMCSDLARALDTARLATAGRTLPWVVDATLRERACGAWERRRLDEVMACGDLDVLHAFDGRPPDGESLRDVAVRVLKFLAVHDDGGDTLVVCHGALMRAVIGVLDGTEHARIGLWKPGNCEIVRRDADAAQLAALARALEA